MLFSNGNVTFEEASNLERLGATVELGLLDLFSIGVEAMGIPGTIVIATWVVVLLVFTLLDYTFVVLKGMYEKIFSAYLHLSSLAMGMWYKSRLRKVSVNLDGVGATDMGVHHAVLVVHFPDGTQLGGNVRKVGETYMCEGPARVREMFSTASLLESPNPAKPAARWANGKVKYPGGYMYTKEGQVLGGFTRIDNYLVTCAHIARNFDEYVYLSGFERDGTNRSLMHRWKVRRLAHYDPIDKLDLAVYYIGDTEWAAIGIPRGELSDSTPTGTAVWVSHVEEVSGQLVLHKSDGRVSARAGDWERYHDGWTTAGDCGLPLLLARNGQSAKVVGIHRGGSSAPKPLVENSYTPEYWLQYVFTLLAMKRKLESVPKFKRKADHREYRRFAYELAETDFDDEDGWWNRDDGWFIEDELAEGLLVDDRGRIVVETRGMRKARATEDSNVYGPGYDRDNYFPVTGRSSKGNKWWSDEMDEEMYEGPTAAWKPTVKQLREREAGKRVVTEVEVPDSVVAKIV